EKARRSLAHFFRQAWHVLNPGTRLLWSWHLDAICLHVQRVVEDWAKARTALNLGEDFEQLIQNLLVNVPPRTAKSLIISVMAPAWAWLHWPDLTLLCLSSNPDVAKRDSEFCRTVIESEWYQRSFEPNWRTTNDAETFITNSAGG